MSEKPIAYLVWLQGRRGADDVEDYYEVARPGDKCVDGSDPFPVFEAGTTGADCQRLLGDVFAVSDCGNHITLHFSEIKSAREFRDQFPVNIVSDHKVSTSPGQQGSAPIPLYGPKGLIPLRNKECVERAHYAEGVADLAIAHRNDAEAALLLVVAYDDLLRSYEGPSNTLFAGDVAEIDTAYDNMVSVVRAALAQAEQVERRAHIERNV